AAAGLGGGNAVKPFVLLVAGEDASLVVEAEADPRTLRVLGDGVEEFDLEAGKDVEDVGLGLGEVGGLREDVVPGADAELAEGADGDLLAVLRFGGGPAVVG